MWTHNLTTCGRTLGLTQVVGSALLFLFYFVHVLWLSHHPLVLVGARQP